MEEYGLDVTLFKFGPPYPSHHPSLFPTAVKVSHRLVVVGTVGVGVVALCILDIAYEMLHFICNAQDTVGHSIMQNQTISVSALSLPEWKKKCFLQPYKHAYS